MDYEYREKNRDRNYSEDPTPYRRKEDGKKKHREMARRSARKAKDKGRWAA